MTRDPKPMPIEAISLIGFMVVLVVGIQLGSIPWRYRKQMHQLQGGAVGVALGFLVGRIWRSSEKKFN